MGSSSDGTSNSSRSCGDLGPVANASPAPELVPSFCDALGNFPIGLRARSGEAGASSVNICALLKRPARPYVTTFLRRSVPASIEDMGIAIALARFRALSGEFVDSVAHVGRESMIARLLADGLVWKGGASGVLGRRVRL